MYYSKTLSIKLLRVAFEKLAIWFKAGHIGWAGRVGYGGESGGVKRETLPARACLCQSTSTHHRFGGTFQYLLTQISEARRMEMFDGME